MTTTPATTDPHGLDLELSRLTDDEQEQLADLLRRARRPQSQPLTVPRKPLEPLEPLEPAPEPCSDDDALAQLDELIEVLSPHLVPGDPSDFDLDSDELVSHDAAVDFALGTITEIADHAPSDGRRLSALNVLGRILGPEHIRNRLMRLANTTKSDATRLSAVYVLSRGLGIVGPIAPRKPEEQRIEVIHVWPASARELEEIRQRDAQAEAQGDTPTRLPAGLPTAARRSPSPTPRDPLPASPLPPSPASSTPPRSTATPVRSSSRPGQPTPPHPPIPPQARPRPPRRDDPATSTHSPASSPPAQSPSSTNLPKKALNNSPPAKRGEMPQPAPAQAGGRGEPTDAERGSPLRHTRRSVTPACPSHPPVRHSCGGRNPCGLWGVKGTPNARRRPITRLSVIPAEAGIHAACGGVKGTPNARRCPITRLSVIPAEAGIHAACWGVKGTPNARRRPITRLSVIPAEAGMTERGRNWGGAGIAPPGGDAHDAPDQLSCGVGRRSRLRSR